MESRTARVHIGVGGWEHEVFDETFYPRRGMPSQEKLAHYARFFDCVEVRSTFWDNSLTESDARQWADAVSGIRAFVFNVKLHSIFTHTRTIQTSETNRMRGILQELANRNRLGTLLVQFPYSFTNTSGNRYYLVKLSELFRGFALHVEFRHESWNQPSILPLLREHSLQSVSVDLPRIRQLMPFIAGHAGDMAYIRLHGRNDKGWLLNGFDTRYDYLYNSKEIQELRRRIEALSKSCSDIFVVCNNTTAGKAIATALQLQSATMDGRAVPVPPATLNAFPQLRQIADPKHQEGSLFAPMPYRDAM
jgi:uncharacterized protein YecE (DUF72 family)